MRSFELSDLDEIMKYWNSMDLRKLLGNVDRGPVARNQEEEWIKDTWKLRQEKRAFLFAIETIADDKLIGGTGLFSFDWTSRSAEAGISIYNPEYWSKGLGSEGMRLIVRFFFTNSDCELLVVPPHRLNPAASRVYEKAGFVLFTGMRSWRNHKIMELSRGRYQELYE